MYIAIEQNLTTFYVTLVQKIDCKLITYALFSVQEAFSQRREIESALRTLEKFRE